MAAVYVVRTLWGDVEDVEDEFLCFLDPFDSSVLVKTVILYLICKSITDVANCLISVM